MTEFTRALKADAYKHLPGRSQGRTMTIGKKTHKREEESRHSGGFSVSEL